MWENTWSMDMPISSQPSAWNWSYRFWKATNSVVQTGVKSAGWLNSTNHFPFMSSGRVMGAVGGLNFQLGKIISQQGQTGLGFFHFAFPFLVSIKCESLKIWFRLKMSQLCRTISTGMNSTVFHWLSSKLKNHFVPLKDILCTIIIAILNKSNLVYKIFAEQTCSRCQYEDLPAEQY